MEYFDLIFIYLFSIFIVYYNLFIVSCYKVSTNKGFFNKKKKKSKLYVMFSVESYPGLIYVLKWQ